MASVIEKPRNGCALHGAVQTIEEIRGVVPIVHSNAGCAVQNYLSKKAGGAYHGGICGYSVPGTAVQERHVIFGGASRLREQIKNTLKVVEGDLYIVLNSCESSMVGDDVSAMAKEAQEQGEPVIDSLLAGFHGDVHAGYEAVMADIMEKIPLVKKIETKKEERLVNIFGILPQQDIYFRGDLAEIKRILEGIGLKANTFFGSSGGVKECEQAGNAALSLVFSRWGLKAAEALNTSCGVPYLVTDIPTGLEEVSGFVNRVLETLHIPEEAARPFLEKEAEEFYYYFDRLEEEFYELHYNRTLALVGDESNVVKLAKFLKHYFLAEIETVIITDFYRQEDLTEDKKAEELKSLAEEIRFSKDRREIRNLLLHSQAELILGSSLEMEAAKKKGIGNLEISYPVYKRAILQKTYTGIRGAVALAEDYVTKIKEMDD